VVNAVNANGPKWCRYGQLVADIQMMVLSTQRSWQIRHIRKVANFAAHGPKTVVKQIMDKVQIE
jgi:hypothetical protein